MATEALLYDLTLLLDTGTDDERREKILADVLAMIERDGGELVGRHDWGVRATAYEVHKHTDADYHLIQFHATPTLLESLNHTLKITEGVLRFRVIKLRRGTPRPPEVRPAVGAPTADATDE